MSFKTKEYDKDFGKKIEFFGFWAIFSIVAKKKYIYIYIYPGGGFESLVVDTKSLLFG